MKKNLFTLNDVEINVELDEKMNQDEVEREESTNESDKSSTVDQGLDKREDNKNANSVYKKVSIKELKENSLNRYIYLAQEDENQLEKLKASIRKIGLIHPIVCKEKDGMFTILSGHLRKRALFELVQEGLSQYQEVQIKVIDVDEESELEYLLDANVVKRNKTDYSKMMEVRGYSSSYEKLKSKGKIVTGLTANKYVSNKMDMGERQIAKYMYINNRLSKEDITELVKGCELSLDKIYGLIQKHGDAFEELFLSKEVTEKKVENEEVVNEKYELLVKEKNAIKRVLKDLERINANSDALLEFDALYKRINKELKRYIKSSEKYALLLKEILDES